MTHLYQVLGHRVRQWREAGYPSPEHPAITEILEWATDFETDTLRFLRRPQLRALETYWYLRLVEGTPHVFTLYRDSTPEMDFFQQLLKDLNLQPAAVEDVYFTGGLTDPAKTDFYVEYRGEDDRWHRYTPDFLIRKRPRPGGDLGSGRVLIVEVKDGRFEAAVREDERRFERGETPVTSEGRKAVALKKLERLAPDRLRYELVFVRGGVTYDQFGETRRFVREVECMYEADLAVANRLKDLILETEGKRVRKIILFGSRARGDAEPDSDYDLLVVLRDLAPEQKHDELVALYHAVASVDIVAEPWVMSEEEFEETKAVIGSLAYPAWKEGVLLYESP